MNELQIAGKTIVWIIVTAVVLQAKILTLSEAENNAVTMGFETRAKYFEEQAKVWEKKNVVSGYLPRIDYTANFLRLGNKTIEETNKVFEGFGETFGNIEILKLNMETLQSKHPEEEYIPFLESQQAESDYANPMTQFKNSLKHEFSINQPVTNGGVEVIAIQIAKHTKRAIDFQIKALRQKSIYNTRKAYFDAIAAFERTKVARQDLSWSKQNLRKANIKYETGSIPVTDVLQWEAEVSKKESAVFEAEATETFLAYTLNQAIGRTPDKLNGYTLQPFESFEKWYTIGLKKTDGSIDNNFDLQALKEFTVVSGKNKNIAVSSFMPKINAFMSLTLEQVFNDNDKFFNIDIDHKPPSFAMGAVMTVPLFSGFRNSTNLKKSSYEYKKSVVEEQKIESQLKVNLKRIKLFYKASYEAVKAAKKQQELMEKQLDIMQKRYDGGLVNQSQLLEVALGESQTRIGYIQKLFECLLYEAEYLKNVGKLEVAQ